MEESITLTGTTDYNPKFPPNNPKKGYVAKITGRAAGALKFNREFMGQEAVILPGDEGLYEKQRGDKKGGATRWYHVILSHSEHGLILGVDCGEVFAAKIAKLLDQGMSIYDIVEVVNLRPSEKVEGRMIFDVEVRTKAETKAAAKSTTIDGAVNSCWDILRLLPEPEAKKVLKELKEKVSPKKEDAEENKPIDN